MKFNYKIAILVGATLVANATGAVILNIVPPSTSVSAGQAVSFDLVISGLGGGTPPSVGSIDLWFSFDPSLLSPAPPTFGTLLGDPSTEALTDFQQFPALVNIAEVSLLTNAELDNLQPSSFTLATLNFTGVASGTANLSFQSGAIDDANGELIYGAKTPEPGSIALVVLGGAVILATRRVRPYLRRGKAPERTANPGTLPVMT